jgi:hypothetical protein
MLAAAMHSMQIGKHEFGGLDTFRRVAMVSEVTIDLGHTFKRHQT